MIIKERAYNNGVQIIHRFPNNRGASVVRHDDSYGSSEGLWELGVLKFDDKDPTPNIGGIAGAELDYSTPVTSDVLGWLSNEDVSRVLAQIEALPPINQE